MSIRLGALCLFENPSREAGRALVRQFVLAREADRMGYDDIWLAERHGDVRRPSAAITALLGHLAGVTSKARIGAIVQPVERNTSQLLEDLSTIELLSRGRLALAVDATGAEGAAAVGTLAGLRGALADGDSPELVPRPSGKRLPSWVVADCVAAVERAAAADLGLWLPEWMAPAAMERLLGAYRAAAPERVDPRPLLTRHACSATSREAAMAIARPFLEELLGVALAESALAQSLVGSHEEVAQQILHLQSALGLEEMVIVPMSAHFDTAKHILADMVDEVRPLLGD